MIIETNHVIAPKLIQTVRLNVYNFIIFNLFTTFSRFRFVT